MAEETRDDTGESSPPSRGGPGKTGLALGLVALAALLYVTIFFKISHYGP